MSSPLNSATINRQDTGSPKDRIVLTPEEKHVYGQLWKHAAKEGRNLLSGQDAVPFFSKSGLSQDILGEIWQLSDADGKGSLDPQGFSIALRLIGHAQNNRLPSAALIHIDGPLPKIEGVAITPLSTPLETRIESPKTRPIVQIEPLSSISPKDRAKYLEMFEKTNPVNGLLDGEKAKGIFMKSKLPLETLAQIWNLADVRKSGSLNQTEFIIAMYFIYRILDGTIKTLPSQLPPSILASAQGSTPSSPTAPAPPNINRHSTMPLPQVVRHSTGTPPSATRHFSTYSPLQRQLTGSLFPSSASINANLTDFDKPEWDVTSEEKQKYDKLFDNIDTAKSGFISGNDAVKFFLSSKLPEHVLYRIWDLSDINKTGRLSREEFAVAMHLIHKKLSGVDLPESLPPTLVPLSMRPSKEIPKIPGLPPVPSSRASMFGRSTSMRLSRSVSSSSGSQTDFFSSSNEVPNSQPQVQNSGSLLDDPPLLGDFEINTKITNANLEIHNMQNQLNSISNAASEAKGKRANLERNLSLLASQRNDLSLRLSQVRALYDAEVKLIQELETNLNGEQQSVQQLMQEVSTSEQAYAEAMEQKESLLTNLQNARNEIDQLKQRLKRVNEDTIITREETERLRREESRQEKLVNVMRGQLSSAEEQLEKAQGVLKDAREQQMRAREAEIGSPIHTSDTLRENPFASQSNHSSNGAWNNPFESGPAESQFASFPTYTGNSSAGNIDTVTEKAENTHSRRISPQTTGSFHSTSSQLPQFSEVIENDPFETKKEDVQQSPEVSSSLLTSFGKMDMVDTPDHIEEKEFQFNTSKQQVKDKDEQAKFDVDDPFSQFGKQPTSSKDFDDAFDTFPAPSEFAVEFPEVGFPSANGGNGDAFGFEDSFTPETGNAKFENSFFEAQPIGGVKFETQTEESIDDKNISLAETTEADKNLASNEEYVSIEDKDIPSDIAQDSAPLENANETIPMEDTTTATIEPLIPENTVNHAVTEATPPPADEAPCASKDKSDEQETEQPPPPLPENSKPSPSSSGNEDTQPIASTEESAKLENLHPTTESTTNIEETAKSEEVADEQSVVTSAAEQSNGSEPNNTQHPTSSSDKQAETISTAGNVTTAFDDEFDAMFRDLPAAKTEAFDAAFDAGFDVEFNPTFDTAFDVAFPAASGFTETSTKDLDTVFGAANGNTVNSNSVGPEADFGFDDSFSTPFTQPPKHEEPAHPHPQAQEEQQQELQQEQNQENNNNAEDADILKELVAMGFSRAQAIEALEKNNYDPVKATNFLLDKSN
ncbi:uncharacterized protein VTP21DRAFT_3258 [Calcarisporiella thermophila]|uniref:uncharacterized protein n=1 Tax=Calcarisporiella thermophila TaxID=911321 RepID=UPI0037441D82